MVMVMVMEAAWPRPRLGASQRCRRLRARRPRARPHVARGSHNEILVGSRRCNARRAGDIRRLIWVGLASCSGVRIAGANMLLMLAGLTVPSIARADVPSPCKACTLDWPANPTARSVTRQVLPTGTAESSAVSTSQSQRKIPLLVVLHGDRERATTAAARWRGAARQRSWAVLSLQCPIELGCTDSWWKWNGDPKWLVEQVSDIAKNPEIDSQRIYLVGWSGGATYIGLHAADWGSHFAAVVIHGGGMDPPDDQCPARVTPVYFLVGDRNPLHYLMKRLRGWFNHCQADIEWDLVRGADHDGEDRALDRKKALAILDWLAERRLSIME